MERDIAATTRMGSRSSTRSGPAAAFVGKVKKWEKKWVKNASERLQLHQWVPVTANPAVMPTLKNDAASDTWKPRFVPAYSSVKRFTPTSAAEPAEAAGVAGSSGDTAGDRRKKSRTSKEEAATEPAAVGGDAATTDAATTDAGGADASTTGITAAEGQGEGASAAADAAIQVDDGAAPGAGAATVMVPEVDSHGEGEGAQGPAPGGAEAGRAREGDGAVEPDGGPVEHQGGVDAHAGVPAHAQGIPDAALSDVDEAVVAHESGGEVAGP